MRVKPVAFAAEAGSTERGRLRCPPGRRRRGGLSALLFGGSHAAAGTSLASFLKFRAMAARADSSRAPFGATLAEPQDALQLREQISTFFHSQRDRAQASTNLTFLVTARDKPLTPNGFGNAFREWRDAVGL